jgi:hypothetical protein
MPYYRPEKISFAEPPLPTLAGVDALSRVEMNRFYNDSSERVLDQELTEAADYVARLVAYAFSQKFYAADFIVTIDEIRQPRRSIPYLSRQMLHANLLPVLPTGETVNRPVPMHMDANGVIRRRGHMLTGLMNPTCGYLLGKSDSNEPSEPPTLGRPLTYSL